MLWFCLFISGVFWRFFCLSSNLSECFFGRILACVLAMLFTNNVPLAVLFWGSFSLGISFSRALTCTGASSRLPRAQCDAWVSFFDSTRGQNWCTDKRADPCRCVGCNTNGTAIVRM